jgi:hypothetical protein
MTMARSSAWMRMSRLWARGLAHSARSSVFFIAPAASELSSSDHLFSRRKSEPRIVGGPTQVKKSLSSEAVRP